MLEPRPRTSSISCSVVRSPSYKPEVGGRVNLKGWPEFSVTMPSYGQPDMIVPFAHIIDGAFRPIARPSALEYRMFVDKGLPGRLPFAVVSFDVVASACRAAM